MRKLVLIVGALLLPAILVPSASADNFSGATGSTGCTLLNMADTYVHTFFYSSVESNMITAIRANNTDIENRSEVDTSELSSVSSTTDVVVYDLNYTTYCGFVWDDPLNNMFGLATCVSTNSARECEKHEVRFDTPDMNAFTSNQRRSAACEEVGHSLGLKHRNGSCMQDKDISLTTLSDHDIAHLNAAYFPN
jgi:hypothetical protein